MDRGTRLLTNWPTNSSLVDLIDVTLACEDCQLKTRWGCYCCWCTCWETCSRQFYADLVLPKLNSGPLCLWQCFYFNCLHHLLIWWALCNHRLLQGKHPLCAVHPSRLCKARWMHFVTLHGIAAKNMRNLERPIFLMSDSSRFLFFPKNCSTSMFI